MQTLATPLDEPVAPRLFGTADTTVTVGAVTSLLIVVVLEPVLPLALVTQTRIVFAPAARFDACTCDLSIVSPVRQLVASSEIT